MEAGLSVHHIAVVVRDLERSLGFYSTVLGLPIVRRWEDTRGRPRSVWLGLAHGAFLAVELATELATESTTESATESATKNTTESATESAAEQRGEASALPSKAKLDAAPGWHCVALGIARGDREAYRGRLAGAGFPVERETAYTLYTRDPDGALVALSHYPEPAA